MVRIPRTERLPTADQRSAPMDSDPRRAAFIALYPGTALEPWEEFPGEKARPLWGERVRAGGASESAPGCRRAGWARSARPDLRRVDAIRRECGGQTKAAIRPRTR